MSLHDDIMNIPAIRSRDKTASCTRAYKEGHRDARHAAAEMSLKIERKLSQLREALKRLEDQ